MQTGYFSNTGKRGAVRINSGLPVDNSGPGLGVGPTTPATAGRKPKACPPSLASEPFYPSQHKSCQGSGDRVPGGGEAAVGSSLVYVTNNRNTPEISLDTRPTGRGRWCGLWTIKGHDPQTGRILYRRMNCGCWTCSYCGKRRAKLAKWAIRDWAERLQLRVFLTLTLDPSKLSEVEHDIQYLRWVFNKFRTYLRRKFGAAPKYIAVVEHHKSGIPHLHVLLDRYIEQKWISTTWDKLGGGRMVWVTRASIRNVSRYLSKYLTKQMLLSAQKGTRRITSARGIKLFEKPTPAFVWNVLQHSVWALLRERRKRNADLPFTTVIAIEKDDEGFLQGFSYVRQVA